MSHDQRREETVEFKKIRRYNRYFTSCHETNAPQIKLNVIQIHVLGCRVQLQKMAVLETALQLPLLRYDRRWDRSQKKGLR